MGRECCAFLKPSAGLPPTRCVGESGVTVLDAPPRALQLVHQRVVLGVADLGRVENVVEMLVAAQFRAQLFDLFCRVPARS
jgi:hypothetical protein